MSKVKSTWVCKDCGSTHRKWSGSCTECGKWDTLCEEISFDHKVANTNRFNSFDVKVAKPVQIDNVTLESASRSTTGLKEVDRLLGGGVVLGSFSLVGGAPGIGKSTMMLTLSEELAKQGKKVLYVCGEESTYQTSMRAKRIGVSNSNIYLLNETVFSNIKTQIEAIKPDILIIDSIQIVYKSEIPSLPGSLTQIKEIAMECMHLAKRQNITTFVIGHVTKSGELAGPKVLEHVVDTVLEFEGDRQHGFRILRAIKNRFGPSDEVAIFEMQSGGLVEVANPSEIFISERSMGSTGSAIVPTLEGSRAILVEVQSLVAQASFANSTRRSTGIDQNRLGLLLAVLEKKMGYHFHSLDVFVSVAGGMKILEPAIDLGILLAIASSFCSRAIGSDVIVIGEVGLGGEVRSVPRIESRIKEAAHLGFRTCILPNKNLPRMDKSIKKLIELKGVDMVEEAIQYLIT
ncbi:MAG: DNA repair protein RadA [Rhabdochlamydiaceae bacterium]|nr:DNA repair protein RadA [Candidatus Amphrikana amoebophyrae]